MEIKALIFEVEHSPQPTSSPRLPLKIQEWWSNLVRKFVISIDINLQENNEAVSLL